MPPEVEVRGLNHWTVAGKSQEESVLNLEMHHLSCNLVAWQMVIGAEDSVFKQGRKDRY